MKWKIGDFKATGLKCDTKGCDYRDDSIQSKDYHKWVNATCPKCGHSLLTPQDYKLVKRLEIGMMIINIVCSPFVIVCSLFTKKTPFQNEPVLHMKKENNVWIAEEVR